MPKGAYGRALLLLGRKGMRRRPNQTVRAFARSAALRFPRTADPLRVLTVMHERERYGGGAGPGLVERGNEALRALKDALRKRPPEPETG